MTKLSERVRSITFAFRRADNRYKSIRKLADEVAQLEEENAALKRVEMAARAVNRWMDCTLDDWKELKDSLMEIDNSATTCQCGKVGKALSDDGYWLCKDCADDALLADTQETDDTD